MAREDYEEIKGKLSPPKKVQWLSNEFLERWVKACQLNAPVAKEGLGETEVAVHVEQSDAKGAEQCVDVIEIMEKYGILAFDVCENGSPVQYDIPARPTAL